MDTGGNPDGDDFGLPRVGVDIPDDARELDRDVQAYHRELRALRRRRLLHRLGGPLGTHGLVMPLIATCLALTLLAGTLLTVFTAGQAVWTPGPLARRTGTQATQPGRIGQPLPDSSVFIDGVGTLLISLPPAVLAVVPPRCRCLAALRQLAGQAAGAQAYIYLIGMKDAQITGLNRMPGLRATHVGEDPGNVLARAYHLSGLTAILVGQDERVAAVIPARGGRIQLGPALRSVAGPPG